MQQQFQQMGLKPGNPDGTYLQNVPLAGVTSKSHVDLSVKGRKLALTDKKNYIAVSKHYVPQVDVKDSPIVFVGYGVVAPEYGWDDYKDVDVKGKTILMLINDPAVPDPANPAKLDDKMFKGSAMTYYGRWTYKYEIASEKGAAAAIIIHETGPAGYPFEVVADSWGGENFDIQHPDNYMSRVPVEGWVTYDKAAELCRMAGLDLAQLKKAAIAKDFKPITLPGSSATFHIDNTLRKIDSHNVIARLEGSDPALKDQFVIYTAHWDHLGRDPDLKGDQIYNGAVDNASGSAGLLEIARAYTKLTPAPKRSILFLSVTAEEQGLLGSEYYAENPLYPLKNTLADLNMDGLNTWGKTKDLTIIGLGNSTLDDIATDVLKSHDRTVTADPKNTQRYFDRAGKSQSGSLRQRAVIVVRYNNRASPCHSRRFCQYNRCLHRDRTRERPVWQTRNDRSGKRSLFRVRHRRVTVRPCDFSTSVAMSSRVELPSPMMVMSLVLPQVFRPSILMSARVRSADRAGFRHSIRMPSRPCSSAVTERKRIERFGRGSSFV